MTTITHALIGGALGILLFTLTADKTSQKRFKAEHVIVLALNSFVGPDWVKFLSPFYGPGYWESSTFRMLNNTVHTIVGWCVFAVALAGIYFLLFRYLGEGRRTGKPPITFFHIYLLIVAGGLNHFGIDMLDSSVPVFPYFMNSSRVLSLATFYTGYSMAEGSLWASMGWFDDKYLLVLGLIFMVLLIWLLKNKPVKWAWAGSLLFAGIVYGAIWLIGSNAVENENDLGLLVYVLIAWLIPIALALLSFDADEKPISSQSVQNT